MQLTHYFKSSESHIIALCKEKVWILSLSYSLKICSAALKILFTFLYILYMSLDLVCLLLSFSFIVWAAWTFRLTSYFVFKVCNDMRSKLWCNSCFGGKLLVIMLLKKKKDTAAHKHFTPICIYRKGNNLCQRQLDPAGWSVLAHSWDEDWLFSTGMTHQKPCCPKSVSVSCVAPETGCISLWN